ncbi:hypothetical protein JCM3774_005830, partial [Rhodotorula dairenensis]
LKKRFAGRQEAKEDEVEAKETGTTEDVDRMSRRQVKVTREHNEECRRLLTLMGIPWVEAPSEAEAQCAELCRGGLVYGAGSEDMDTLTFNSPVVLRHLTFSEARKMPIDVISLDEVLAGLELSMDQFIDMCMLCGCDYLEPLKGIGAKTALKLVREYDDMDAILEHLRKGKNPPPDEWPYQEARELFRHPDVKKASEIELKWEAPDTEGLVDFLVREKGFSEERVRKGADKLKARMSAKQQGRLDGFFTVKPKEGASASGSSSASGKKRKADDKKDTGKNGGTKKAKAGSSASKKK